MRSSADVLADSNHADVQKGMDPNDPLKMVQALDKRAGDLEAEAQRVQEFGIEHGRPNPQAQQNYLKASALLRKRARDLHAQWQESLNQKMQAQQQQEAQQQAQQQQTQQMQQLQQQQQQAAMPPTVQQAQSQPVLAPQQGTTTGGFGR
jgi:cell division protein FtsN